MIDRFPTKSHLERLVTQHAKDTGIAVVRLRRWISTMALLGALDTARDEHNNPLFVLKGGVALELRLGTTARATNDVDATFYGKGDQLEHVLATAFSIPISGFKFDPGQPVPIGTTGAMRFTTHLIYGRRPWATIDVELAVAKPPADLEYIPAIDIAHFGLTGPDRVAALSLRYQLAQKLHAVSQTFPTGENRRVRDIVDILLMRALVTDLGSVNQACHEVFDSRNTIAWPPAITIYPSWSAVHLQNCDAIGFNIRDIAEAVAEVDRFVIEIDLAGSNN